MRHSDAAAEILTGVVLFVGLAWDCLTDFLRRISARGEKRWIALAACLLWGCAALFISGFSLLRGIK